MNMGFVTMITMILPNSVNENNLLSWQLINSSPTACLECKQAICTNKLIQQNVEPLYVATIINGHGLTETRNSNPFY